MKLKVVIAILLVALGITALAYQGITYTSIGKAIDFGPVHVTTGETRHSSLPPILGAIALVCGIVLLVLERNSFGRAAAH